MKTTRNTNANYQKQSKLKTAISEIALKYVANKKGMTIGEYGQVYDAEAWESMLNRILTEVEEVDL